MVEDYAVYLSDEARSGLAALHQFRLLHSDTEEVLHLFFEGDEDSLFYMPEVRRRAAGRCLHTYVCGGKTKVIDARNAIHSEGYDLSFCMFFVDRDLDDYFGEQVVADDATYITDCYSIENVVVSQSSVEILLDDIVCVSRADPEWQAILEDYARAEARFSSSIRPFMAWCIAARDEGSQPVLRNVELQKVFGMSAGGGVEKRRRGFETFARQAAAGGPGASRPRTLFWHRRLQMVNRQTWIRGKWELWWFQMALITLLGESSVRRMAAGGKRWKIPAALREKRIMDVLGGRLPPPTSLREFLDRRMTQLH